jgi:hypothetical protein
MTLEWKEEREQACENEGDGGRGSKIEEDGDRSHLVASECTATECDLKVAITLRGSRKTC